MTPRRLLCHTKDKNDSSIMTASFAGGWLKAVVACIATLLMAAAFVVCAPGSAQAAETGLKDTKLQGTMLNGDKVDVDCSYTILSGSTSGVSIKKLYSSTAYSLSLPNTIDGIPVAEVKLSDSTYGSSDMGSIRSLTIKNIDTLTTVICEQTYLEDVTVSSCPKLIKADFSLSQRLKTATCSFNTKLTSLDVRNCYALTHLYCQGNALGGMLDVSTNDKLEYLDCTDNKYISSIPDLVTLKNLQTLLCSQNELTTLTLRNLPQLSTVECMYNKLQSLDVAGCSKLEKLLCYNNKLEALELKTVSALKELDCSNNLLRALDISGNTNLGTLLCNDNRITDVSNLQK